MSQYGFKGADATVPEVDEDLDGTVEHPAEYLEQPDEPRIGFTDEWFDDDDKD